MGHILQGTVVSDASDKTIVVSVVGRKMHPIYRKSYKTSKKYHAHDEQNQAKVGDIVTIAEIRPMSKLKRWQLQDIIGSTGLVHKEEDAGAPEEKAA